MGERGNMRGAPGRPLVAAVCVSDAFAHAADVPFCGPQASGGVTALTLHVPSAN